MEELFKIGQRVEVSGKDVQGVITFFGATHFATGKWIGLILDEPKGKNNGSVRGHVYFQVTTKLITKFLVINGIYFLVRRKSWHVH